MISQEGGYYTFRNGNPEDSHYLSAPAGNANGTQIITSSSSSRNKWTLEKYTGSINEAGFLRFTKTVIVGETYDFDGYMVSSSSGHNGPVTWEVKSKNGLSDTPLATINATTGEMTARKPGVVQVRMKNPYLNSIWFGEVTIEESLAGTYFFKNAELGNYLQIDNDASASDDGAILELWDLDGDNDQRWKIEFAVHGFYKIISLASGKAITAPSTLDESLTQKTYTGAAEQLWSIVPDKTGGYCISPRSFLSAYMAAGDGAIVTSGRNAELRKAQSDNRHVWKILSPINVGFSTDNYTDGCDYDDRQSYRYANKFFDRLIDSQYDIAFYKIHHYNKDSVRTASKKDFSINGAISNDVDFMIYIGHGLQANNSKGNRLHYNCAPDGTHHTTDCNNSVYNAYSSEMRFGSSSSNLRWVWLYTCNFLTTNDYVTENDLKKMMTGAHIVMGYASTAYLCDAMAETFATYLREGKPIIRAYFDAGHDGEASVTNEDYYQRVMYIPQAEHETIYSPKMHYEYNSSNVIIYTKNIQD